MARSTQDKTVKVGDIDAKVSYAPGWTNWRTLIANAAMAAAIPVLSVMSTTNWEEIVPPTVAVYVVLGVNVALRFLSKGPAMSDVKVRQVD